MQIWVDADACPKAVKEMLYRVAERRQVALILVANVVLRVPSSRFISTLLVEKGFDVADGEIAKRLAAGDLVITADIPLAAEAIARGGHALNYRGEFYSRENVGQKLAMRNLFDELRQNGMVGGGPPPLRPQRPRRLRQSTGPIFDQGTGRGAGQGEPVARQKPAARPWTGMLPIANGRRRGGRLQPRKSSSPQRTQSSQSSQRKNKSLADSRFSPVGWAAK